jgi:hypothetical protein
VFADFCSLLVLTFGPRELFIRPVILTNFLNSSVSVFLVLIYFESEILLNYRHAPVYVSIYPSNELKETWLIFMKFGTFIMPSKTLPRSVSPVIPASYVFNVCIPNYIVFAI